MSHIEDKSEFSIGSNIRAAREALGWSGAKLASAAGVSRSMIDRIERNVSSPTTDLLGKLSAALETTMAALLTPAPVSSGGVHRAAEKPEWTDTQSGYRRRQITRMPQFSFDLTDVNMPAGAQVSYPAGAYAFVRHLVWMLDGSLTIHYGEETMTLDRGDSIVMDEARDITFHNDSSVECRYAVAVAPKP